eukprot:TRINITY_DN26669_c0_g1_i2.p1 TRINITY_DN26669_c0_g1~~TRINITY_DN26669_c0_g1_i2.p1  ORF type:complete len:653 (+),score=90.78 TRINITY_DN26669_c0_g1_i2:99-2057(+)
MGLLCPGGLCQPPEPPAEVRNTAEHASRTGLAESAPTPVTVGGSRESESTEEKSLQKATLASQPADGASNAAVQLGTANAKPRATFASSVQAVPKRTPAASPNSDLRTPGARRFQEPPPAPVAWVAKEVKDPPPANRRPALPELRVRPSPDVVYPREAPASTRRETPSAPSVSAPSENRPSATAAAPVGTSHAPPQPIEADHRPAVPPQGEPADSVAVQLSALQECIQAEPPAAGGSPLRRAPSACGLQRAIPSDVGEAAVPREADAREDGDSTVNRAPRDRAARHCPEDVIDLRPGGYPAVPPGTVLCGCLRVVKPLGKGGYGAVWLAEHMETGELSAVKISRGGKAFLRAASKELALLCRAKARDQDGWVVHYCFHTVLSSSAGSHLALGLELMGPDVARFYDRNPQGVDLRILNCIIRQVLQGLDLLAGLMIAHCDLKPGNILLTAACRADAPARPGFLSGKELMTGEFTTMQGESLEQALTRQFRVKLADFGGAVECQSEVPAGSVAQSIPYRSPEVLAGAHRLTPAADLWSVGCIAYEFVTGAFLFDPRPKDPPRARDQAQWSIWAEALGPPPDEYTDAAKYWRALGVRHRIALKQRHRKDGAMLQWEVPVFYDFLTTLLKYEPEQRAKPRELLAHLWLRIEGARNA